MTDKNQDSKNIHTSATTEKNKLKTCFVIMPIADVASYDTGHFHRVYQHLIKPACELAGFKPIRADDVNSSHMIVVDILKKIVECDIAICDLSARNPNVLYELGLRQAFNKKTVLIKDGITESIFDVQGFRYAQYDNFLRIDNVKNEILKLSNALKETYESQNEINSIVQLLQIEPAKIENKTELSDSDTVIFRAITDLTKKVENLNNRNHSLYSRTSTGYAYYRPSSLSDSDTLISFYDDAKEPDFPDQYIGDVYHLGSAVFGSFLGIDKSTDEFVFMTPNGDEINITRDSDAAKVISRFLGKSDFGS